MCPNLSIWRFKGSRDYTVEEKMPTSGKTILIAERKSLKAAKAALRRFCRVVS